MRWLSAFVILGVALVACWYCWFCHSLDPTFLPGQALRSALLIAVGMTLTSMLLLTPALLAHAFASDSQLETIGLLLSTRVSAGEIVFSRFISRLCQVGIVAAAGLPGICFLAEYAGIGLKSQAVMLLLTAAVACGCAGIALSCSVLFNRGRDALIGTYTLGLAFLFLPMLGAARLPGVIATWLETLNPFRGLYPLIEYGQTELAWQSILAWSMLAVVGVLLASRLLRPGYLRRVGGKSNIVRRRRNVPPLGDCPIRWKELYIEADRDFGRLARIIGQLILWLMIGSSTLLMALYFWSAANSQSSQVIADVLGESAVWIKTLMPPMSWLVQLGVGVRAAAGIATERERGTWDALMMTPLGGGQIVKAKMVESFYALRWFLGATVMVWSLGVLLEAVDLSDFFVLALRAVASIGFMSAVGVWCSLYAKTSGRAITLALSGWLAGKVFFTVASTLLVLVSMLGYYLIWSLLGLLSGRRSAGMPAGPMSFESASLIFELALCIGTTIAIAWYCRLRFDKLAGRCPARSMPVTFEVVPNASGR